MPTTFQSSRAAKLALISMVCLLVTGLSSVCLAQSPLSPVTNTKEPGSSGLVEIEGEKLFTIQSKLGPFTRETRAKNIVKRIDRLLDDPDFKPADISYAVSDTTIDIIAGDIIITSITDDDAKLAATNKRDLAESYIERLQDVLVELRAKRTVKGALEDVSAKNFGQDIMHILLEPTSVKFALVAIGALFILSISTLIKKSLGRYISDSSNRYNAKKVITITSYLLLLLFSTVVFRDALGNLAVILGATAAGVAFALKEVIISIAGWLAVTFGDFYKVGDRVELGGIKGDVIDIGLNRTTLMELGEWVKGDLYTGRIVRVDNSVIFKDPMFNYSRDFPFLWDEITVPVKYGSDYDLTEDLLTKCVEDICIDYVTEAGKHWDHITKKFMVERAQIEPMVTYNFNDNWVEFTIRYVVDYKKRRVTKFLISKQILKDFQIHKDKIGMASATFHLVEAPVFDVRLESPRAVDA